MIDKIVFSNKPYDIPAITKDAVDAMGFDDEYYTSSTPEEIDAFYKKWCTVSNDDIPDDDAEVPIYDAPASSNSREIPSVQNDLHSNDVEDISADDLDDLVGDDSTESNLPKNEIKDLNSAPSQEDASKSEIDELLNGIDL